MNDLYISRFENKMFKLKVSEKGYLYAKKVVKCLNDLYESEWRRIGLDRFNQIKHECILKVN